MSQLRLIIRASARRDFEKIVRYIALNSDVVTAERYYLRLFQCCVSLIDAPGSGKPYGRKSGIRKINEGSHKIYYCVTETEIIILRLWDGRRGSEPRLSE